MKIVLAPFFIVIGLVALLLSIPLCMISLLIILGGFSNEGEWLMDHVPLMLWFDFVESL